MQKITLIKIIREEILRAVVFASTLLVLVVAGSVGVAYAAADGGYFGQLLNQILASGNWQTPGDGTVNNSNKLGGYNASDFVRAPAGFNCGAGKCITGVDGTGVPVCN